MVFRLPRLMSTTIWYFLRTAPGELDAVALSAFEAFAVRDGKLRPSADGYVRYVEVVVEMTQHSPVRLVSASFRQMRANDDGSRSEAHAADAMRAAVASLDTKTGSVSYDHLSVWEPTSADQAKLRELVNAKAHRELM